MTLDAVARPIDHPPPRPRRPARSISKDALLGGLSLGAVAVAWWPLLAALRAAGPLRIDVVLAHVCGMLAGYGILVLLLLMSRTPALERGIGGDVLARYHSRGGRIVLSLILVHAFAALSAWANARGQTVLSASMSLLGLPWLTAATVGTVMLVVVALASVRAARRRLSYEKWHGLHLLTYVAVALSFVHELAGPDLAGNLPAQILWALMFTHVFALLFRYRVIEPVRNARRHRLRVSRVVHEAPGVVSIEITGHHLDELRAESGQFFRWRFLTPDLWTTAHPFSLSAAPRSDRLRLTVKTLGEGSARLQSIDVGTWVIAEGPYGAMTAARRTRRHVLLVAGGVGITPMRALFETMPTGPGQDLTLLYRARDESQLVFRDELDAIARARGARLVYLLGDDRTCLSSTALLRNVPLLRERDVYLCGPAAMADAVRSSLLDAGLPQDQLHEERFAF